MTAVHLKSPIYFSGSTVVLRFLPGPEGICWRCRATGKEAVTAGSISPAASAAAEGASALRAIGL